MQQQLSTQESDVRIISCPKCGRDNVVAHATDKHLCTDCVNTEHSRLTNIRMHQEDWMAQAKEQGIDPWLQQPGETQWEYSIWCAYRDSYPGKRPDYRAAAVQLDTTYNAVAKVAQRWTFPARIQAWITFVDSQSLLQRRAAIQQMNEQHITMAQTLNEKLKLAIAAINPTEVKPAEIASLMKTAAELERKAQLDRVVQDELTHQLTTTDTNASLQKKKTNVNDLNEVVAILAKAGALDSLKLKQTVTTEISVGQDAIDVDAMEVDYEQEEG